MLKLTEAHYQTLTIIGGGNMGRAIARGFVDSGRYVPSSILITRHQVHLLDDLKDSGFLVSSDNLAALKHSKTVLIAVDPQHLDKLLKGIAPALQPDHVLISIVTAAPVRAIRAHVGNTVQVVRAMPNTAIKIRESMTCLASDDASPEVLQFAKDLFSLVGQAVVIREELMIPATALCACGIAFFLRSVRAASQGGIEIGFHAEDALLMAAQTAKGAASLLIHSGAHPEGEIDKVTTPRGCTIAGLNEMEHQGFSSAMILGIKTSVSKASQLYQNKS